jgi:hypothetical protein
MPSSASIEKKIKSFYVGNSVEQVLKSYFLSSGKVQLLKDCTVKLDFKLEDGTKIQGELTFIDVSWWDCTKMQLGAWWARNF